MGLVLPSLNAPHSGWPRSLHSVGIGCRVEHVAPGRGLGVPADRLGERCGHGEHDVGRADAARRRPAPRPRRSARASAEPGVGVGKPHGRALLGGEVREAGGGRLGGDAGLVPDGGDDDAHAVDVARLRVVAGGEVGDHLGVLERRHDVDRRAGLGAVRGRRHVVGELDGLGARLGASAAACAVGSLGARESRDDERADGADGGDEGHDARDAHPDHEATLARRGGADGAPRSRRAAARSSASPPVERGRSRAARRAGASARHRGRAWAQAWRGSSGGGQPEAGSGNPQAYISGSDDPRFPQTSPRS